MRRGIETLALQSGQERIHAQAQRVVGADRQLIPEDACTWATNVLGEPFEFRNDQFELLSDVSGSSAPAICDDSRAVSRKAYEPFKAFLASGPAV